MSLDVYLQIGDERIETCPHCDGTGNQSLGRETVYEANVTHNLNVMAEEAGIYDHLWRPDEIGITKAGQLIEPLKAGVALMRAEPQRFMALNPENGWGSYGGFVPWIERYIAACEHNPDADVRTCR